MNRLDGKVAIITGAASGIGEAIAQLFAKEGAKVVLVDVQADKLDTVADKVKAAGGNVVRILGDISDPATAVAMVDTAVEEFGKLDILINNAGILDEGLKPIDKVEDRVLDRLLNINTKGTFYCTREALKVMLPNKSGAIVNVGSQACKSGGGGAAYSVSKGAIMNMTLHTAMRAARERVRCNMICPGVIFTPMLTSQPLDSFDKEMFAILAAHTDQSIGPQTPEEIADVTLFLASDDARRVNGQVIFVDDGSSL
jgi:NAD(P)-dependent dehydrogenase (short-subunit alcohol dehydrogenase family)